MTLFNWVSLLQLMLVPFLWSVHESEIHNMILNEYPVLLAAVASVQINLLNEATQKQLTLTVVTLQLCPSLVSAEFFNASVQSEEKIDNGLSKTIFWQDAYFTRLSGIHVSNETFSAFLSEQPILVRSPFSLKPLLSSLHPQKSYLENRAFVLYFLHVLVQYQQCFVSSLMNEKKIGILLFQTKPFINYKPGTYWYETVYFLILSPNCSIYAEFSLAWLVHLQVKLKTLQNFCSISYKD